MPSRLSEVLHVAPESLQKLGVFNSFVDMDSRLHVDPHLLKASQVPELHAAAKAIDLYWKDTLVVLRSAIETGDVFWRKSVERLTFPENQAVNLGYSEVGNAGSGIGREKAQALTETALAIVRAGISEPRIFEIVGLFESRIGADLISDMTIHIVFDHLVEFTERVCGQLKIELHQVTAGKRSVELPQDPDGGGPIVFIPEDCLRALPTAHSWDTIDLVAGYNETQREEVNQLIGENWKEATKTRAKDEIKLGLLNNPDVLRDLLGQYEAKPAIPYDFNTDVLGESIWFEAASELAAAFPFEVIPEADPGQSGVKSL